MKRYKFTIAAILCLVVSLGIGFSMINSSWKRNEAIDALQTKIVELDSLRDLKAKELNRLLENERITQSKYDIEYDALIAGAEKTVLDIEESKKSRKSAQAEMISGIVVCLVGLILSITLGAKAVKSKK